MGHVYKTVALDPVVDIIWGYYHQSSILAPNVDKAIHIFKENLLVFVLNVYTYFRGKDWPVKSNTCKQGALFIFYG